MSRQDLESELIKCILSPIIFIEYYFIDEEEPKNG